MPTIVIAAGGTAGHVVPALAVAGELRASGADVHFVGGDRAEVELVPAAGFAFHRLNVEGIDRGNPLRAARAVGLAVAASARARRLLKRLDADAVMGGGGYVAAPVGVAARSLALPVVATEADSHLGITNKLLARFADRVFLAFPIAGRDGAAYRVVGRPLPPGTGRADRAEARERFALDPLKPCLLVFGGSLGARRINEATIDAFGASAPFEVLHACGRRDHDALAERLEELGSPPHYHLHPYIDDFAAALAAADLVVARSGGSVLEVAAAGLPSVLVPYPHATADHQTLNAGHMERAGAAVVVRDSELDGPRLAREVGELLGAPQRMAAMGRAARGVARPDAARVVADELLALAAGDRP